MYTTVVQYLFIQISLNYMTVCFKHIGFKRKLGQTGHKRGVKRLAVLLDRTVFIVGLQLLSRPAHQCRESAHFIQIIYNLGFKGLY